MLFHYKQELREPLPHDKSKIIHAINALEEIESEELKAAIIRAVSYGFSHKLGHGQLDDFLLKLKDIECGFWGDVEEVFDRGDKDRHFDLSTDDLAFEGLFDLFYIIYLEGFGLPDRSSAQKRDNQKAIGETLVKAADASRRDRFFAELTPKDLEKFTPGHELTSRNQNALGRALINLFDKYTVKSDNSRGWSPRPDFESFPEIIDVLYALDDIERHRFAVLIGFSEENATLPVMLDRIAELATKSAKALSDKKFNPAENFKTRYWFKGVNEEGRWIDEVSAETEGKPFPAMYGDSEIPEDNMSIKGLSSSAASKSRLYAQRLVYWFYRYLEETDNWKIFGIKEKNINEKTSFVRRIAELVKLTPRQVISAFSSARDPKKSKS